MILPLKIAWRYLVSKKGHQAVNIISIVAVCGIVVATAALICVLSVFNGFKGLIMGRLALLDPQIAITATMGKTINDADSVIEVVSAIPGVERAVPTVTDQALAIYAQYQMPVRLKGVPDDYNTMNGMDSVIVDGVWKMRDEVSRFAVVGAGPAMRLGVRPEFLGMVRLYAPQRQGRVNIANPMGAFRQDSLFVSGIFQLQQNSYDVDLIYVPLNMARNLFDYDTQATSIEVKLATGVSDKQVMRDIANMRLEIARLMGYKCFAEYRLQRSMAETPQAVYGMLDQLREAYLPVERADMERLTAFASELEGHPVEIRPWDFSYYSNKEKDSLFEINDELLRPYFELSSVTHGVFGFAKRMYGLNFSPNYDAQVFHPEVEVYDVTDADGKAVGMLYLDFFPRATKQSGAWMTSFREQYIDDDGNDVRPLVTLTMNFTRPTESKPSLLTLREVETFMHEFGHALHQLLSRCKYQSLSGTNVYRDFVEVPSQFNENYVYEREFLDSFARHYQTGEPVPQVLIDKLIASSQYGAAYACVRQLGFGYIDMAWHSISEPYEGDDFEFEYNAIKDVQAFEPVDGCIMSTHFTHIFSGGYAAGYYGYKWAEMIECDAFDQFKQDGIFNRDTARSWVDNVLSRGGTEAPMTLYKRFRGAEPGIDAMMCRDGISLTEQKKND